MNTGSIRLPVRTSIFAACATTPAASASAANPAIEPAAVALENSIPPRGASPSPRTFRMCGVV